MEIKFNELKEGWTYEYDPRRSSIYIMRPNDLGGGFVTIGLKSRGFALGLYTRITNPQPEKYKGRAWLDRLIEDAVKSLEEAMQRAP